MLHCVEFMMRCIFWAVGSYGKRVFSVGCIFHPADVSACPSCAVWQFTALVLFLVDPIQTCGYSRAV